MNDIHNDIRMFLQAEAERERKERQAKPIDTKVKVGSNDELKPTVEMLKFLAS